MRRSLRTSVLVAVIVACAPAAEAQLTRDQQKCVRALNKGLAKTAAAVGKETLGCIQDHNQGDVSDIPACVDDDANDKIARASGKVVLDFDRRCVGIDGDGAPLLPPALATDDGTVVASAVANGRRMLTAIYGPDVDAAALTEAEDETGARCQAAVAKRLLKCRDTALKEFNRCKKEALETATTAAELAPCVLADPKEKIARACDLTDGTTVDKVRQDLTRKCVAQGADLTVAFPQCGAGDVETVHACLEEPVECAACLAMNAADDLEADCDLLDDGAANASCLRPLDLLLPAYANPCCDGGPLMWTTLEDVAASALVRVNVILNPASGPGASPIDANYVSNATTGPLLDVRAAGAVVFGYVTTSYATRDVADVKAEVDRYYSLAYWRGAGIQVDGIFFDELSNDLANVGYNEELRDHVRAKDPRARVIGNPGVPTTFDSSGGSSGFTVADYSLVADTLVTFEHDGNEYRTNYTAPSWLSALSARHFAHLVHGEASSTDMATDVALARARKAGMLYVTDDTLVPNPWDALATYFAAELAAME
jgi:hypothetical protein